MPVSSPERNEVLEEELRKLQERLKHLEVNFTKDAVRDLSSTEMTSREMKSQEFQEGMCPVHLDESIWSIAVVIGLEHSMFNGFFDFFVSAILAMVTAVTQILLGVALYADWLRPEVQVSDANAWRNLLAHDAKYLDLSGNSLATQACSAASGFAGPAGSMIQEINLYLGLSNDQFDMSTFRPGTVVCVLSILIWSLCVMKELRGYWLMIQAIFWLPRAAMSEMEGTLVLSCNRVWILISLYALRTIITVALLAGGIRLLGNTTSLLQMILITAALPVILNIDKQFFRAVLPMEIKMGIQRFKPFRIHYSRLHSQIETFVAAFLVLAVLLVSYSEVVRVFEEGILDIKVQLCGGQQAFVVAHNPSSQLTYALQTGTSQGAAVQAVEFYRYSSPSSPSPSPWVILSSEESFHIQASRSMKEEAALALCWEEQTDAASSLLAAAALALKHNESTASCQDLAQKCQEPSARLLRMACGVTCGCSEPHSSPWYKVEAQGCSSACLASASSTASVIPCQDMDKTNQTWQDLWDEYIPALSSFLTLSGNETTALLQTVQDMKSQGCSSLLQQPFEPATGAKWCDGHPELFRPISYLCPSSCGRCR